MPDTVQAIISQMTLEEKVALCIGASPWTTTPVDRLDIPGLVMSDGPHGVRRVPDVNAMMIDSLPATCFPSASCLASTWDVDLMRTMGEALAEECLALDVDVLLGPGANMKRSPLGGRNFEYFSEDPYLAGEMAASLIEGIQSGGVGACLKHFAVNNQEFQRLCISAEVDERTLREIYLPAFEKAVRQAEPWAVMCAYNKLNGIYCSEHHELLTEILKQEWGFEGMVISDWGAVHDRAASFKGGIDLEMPGPQPERVQAVMAAVQAGELDEAVIDRSVRRILNLVLRAEETPDSGTFVVDEHHELAKKIAAEGMVLLKNDGLLPLKAKQNLAIIGRSAEEARFQGGGSSHINPTRVSVPFSEMQARAGDAELTYAEGYPSGNDFRQDLIDQAVSNAETAEAAVLFISLPGFKESEGYDRVDLDLTDQQIALIQAVARVQPRTAVVLNNGAPVAMSDWIDGVAAVLEGWMMGQAGGAAIADLLFGKANPCGKLAETFPIKLADTPAHINWPGDAGKVRYGEGLFIGYRYYDVKQMPVQFPFGFGLSYTTFTYSNAQVSATRFKDVDGVMVTVDVTNTGEVPGKEVVQIYVRDRQSGLTRPDKELKGFAKVELQPGETQSVSVSLDFRAFAYFHPGYQRWITEDGDFDLLIAASAADVRQVLSVTLESTLDLPSLLDKESTIREWMDDPRGRAVSEPIFAKIEAENRRMLAGEAEHGSEDTGGMDPTGMILDMPLESVLRWQQSAWSKPAGEIVDDLLAEVHNST
jgi:beta-glucosidase